MHPISRTTSDMKGMVKFVLLSSIVAVTILHIGCGLHVVPVSLAGGESSSQYQYGAVNNADKVTCDGGTNNLHNKSHNEHWWEPCVRKSENLGPLVLSPFPHTLKWTGNLRDSAQTILAVLDFLGVSPMSGHRTIIDIGLPTESLIFASNGYSTQSFEARISAYVGVKEQVEEQRLGHLIHLHHAALSNMTGTTQIYDAADSSSLLESAILQNAEKTKFDASGRTMESVSLHQLDTYVTSAVGMKIDTQGVEPEIFMGAERLLTSRAGAPHVIFMEYCSRFRPIPDLLRGVHLLRGLGYTCYRTDNKDETILLGPATAFCSDLICMRV